MAMAGVGCRAQSAALVRPSTFMKLGQVAAQQGNWSTRHYSPSASPTSWRTGSRASFLGDIFFGFGEQRNERVELRKSSPAQRLCIRAINVSGPGSVDSPLMQSMQAKIKDDLNAESVSVKDAYGDGRHVSIDVVASVFEGKSAVNRQRMVYKAIWEELQGTVHAVDQLKTRTPSEAESAPDQL
ncbi:unnamed protein product [Calypogeia fissa]